MKVFYSELSTDLATATIELHQTPHARTKWPSNEDSLRTQSMRKIAPHRSQQKTDGSSYIEHARQPETQPAEV